MVTRSDVRRLLVNRRQTIERCDLGLSLSATGSSIGISTVEAAAIASVPARCYSTLERGYRWRGTPSAVIERVARALLLPKRDQLLLLEYLERRGQRRHMPPMLERIDMWWSGTMEIGALTRDFEQEQRMINAASTILHPGAWNIAELFHHRPHPCVDG